MSLNKENIRKWVKALRSGRYRQTREVLKSTDGNKHAAYCCLGVACKLAYDEGLDFNLVDTFDNCNDLPDPVQKWFGFTNSNPNLKVNKSNNKVMSKINKAKAKGFCRSRGGRIGAIDLNDEANLNFKEIADCIECTYLSEK